MSNATPQGGNPTLAPGTAIIKQGDSATTLVILNQGMAVARRSDENGNTTPLFTIKAPAIIGAGSLAEGKAHAYSVIAQQGCAVQSYPANRDSLVKIFATKPNIGVLFLRSVYQDALEASNRMTQLGALLDYLVKADAALSIGMSVLAPDKFAETQNTVAADSAWLNRAKQNLKLFKEGGGNIPSPLTMAFFRADHTVVIRETPHIEAEFDKEELAYLKRVVAFPANVQLALLQKDPAFFILSAAKLNRILGDIIEGVEEVARISGQYAAGILEGNDSFCGFLGIHIGLFRQNMVTTSHTDMHEFAGYLTEIGNYLQQKAPALIGRNLNLDAASWKATQDFAAEEKAEAAPARELSAEEKAGRDKILAQIRGSAKQIFQYAEMPGEKFTEYQKLLKQFNALKNPLDHEGDARKIRRAMNNLYWEVYETAVLKYLRNRQNLPKTLKLFFNFGILEDTLLDEDQLVFFFENMDQKPSKYPIYYALEWLELIFDKKVPTSLNELGLTFFELLKQDNRDANWKKESDLPANVDSPEARVKYEIKNMLVSTVRLTSGSILNHFSLLSKYQITQSLDRAVVTREKMEAQLDHLLSVDFSAFHREVLFTLDKDPSKREFVQVQVVPNFIIVPSAGPHFQFWQDRDGKDKAARGRLIGPAMAMNELFDMLLACVGALRWETIKTILGPDWNNISKSSLTADYTDYVQFFKKNRELSVEAKEKLAVEFKRFRDDRARFVNDYLTWIKFESEGTQRFNRVARKIFSKHIPFAKPLRDKLLKQPSFTEVIQKSINIRKRKAVEMEPRLKKYRQDFNGELPKELVETYRFYNMEF